MRRCVYAELREIPAALQAVTTLPVLRKAARNDSRHENARCTDFDERRGITVPDVHLNVTTAVLDANGHLPLTPTQFSGRCFGSPGGIGKGVRSVPYGANRRSSSPLASTIISRRRRRCAGDRRAKTCLFGRAFVVASGRMRNERLPSWLD